MAMTDRVLPYGTLPCTETRGLRGKAINNNDDPSRDCLYLYHTTSYHRIDGSIDTTIYIFISSTRAPVQPKVPDTSLLHGGPICTSTLHAI